MKNKTKNIKWTTKQNKYYYMQFIYIYLCIF